MPQQVPSSVTAPSAPPPGHRPDLRTKAARARVSERKRRKAKELAHKLVILRDGTPEPELAKILARAAEEATLLSESTRKGDRDAVYKVLSTYSGAEVEDIMDETRLSRWVVDEILKEFETNKIAKKTELPDPADAGGRPRHLWTLCLRLPPNQK